MRQAAVASALWAARHSPRPRVPAAAVHAPIQYFTARLAADLLACARLLRLSRSAARSSRWKTVAVSHLLLLPLNASLPSLLPLTVWQVPAAGGL